MSTKQLHHRQARWAEYLSRFNFVIKYRPGKHDAKPDALTRKREDFPGENDQRSQHQSQTVIKKKNLDHSLSMFATLKISDRDQFQKLLEQANLSDKFPTKILTLIKSGQKQSNQISLAECEEIDNKLYYREKLFVPE